MSTQRSLNREFGVVIPKAARLNKGQSPGRARVRATAALIVTYMFVSESWFLHLSRLGNAIRLPLVIGIPILLLFPLRKPSRTLGRFAGVAFATLLWATVLTAWKSQSNQALVALVGTFFTVLFLLGISFRLREPRVRTYTLRLFFWVSVLLAAQVSVTFVLTMIGSPPPINVIALHGKANIMRTYGIWGFAEGTSGFDSGFSLYRAQSWWGEPAAFALWLEAAVGTGLWLARSAVTPRIRRRYWRATAIVVVALLLTFSMAAFLAAAAAGGVWQVNSRMRRSDLPSRFIAIAGLALLFAFTFPAAVRTMNHFSERQDRLAFAIGKSPRNTQVKIGVASASIRYSFDHPEGVGWTAIDDLPEDAASVEEASSSALAFWLFRLGVLAVPLVVLFVVFVSRLALRGLHVAPGLAFGLATATVHQIGFGTWLYSSYLLLVAALSLEIDQQVRTKVAGTRSGEGGQRSMTRRRQLSPSRGS